MLVQLRLELRGGDLGLGGGDADVGAGAGQSEDDVGKLALLAGAERDLGRDEGAQVGGGEDGDLEDSGGEVAEDKGAGFVGGLGARGGAIGRR